MKIAAAWWSLSGDGFWPNGSAVNYLPYWERWLDTVGAEVPPPLTWAPGIGTL